MNQENLQKLAGISDVEELRRAIEELCLPFGRVRDIPLLPDQSGKQYLCFVKLDSPHLNLSMLEKLGGISYGNCVAFRIPFEKF
jgi:hypothetical protein